MLYGVLSDGAMFPIALVVGWRIQRDIDELKIQDLRGRWHTDRTSWRLQSLRARATQLGARSLIHSIVLPHCRVALPTAPAIVIGSRHHSYSIQGTGLLHATLQCYTPALTGRT